MNHWIKDLCLRFGFLLLLALPADGRPREATSTERLALPTRSPADILPSLGVWFWTEAEFRPEGYRPFLDLVGKHAAFSCLTASLRAPNREVTDPAVHDQIKTAAKYAERHGIRLVMDLDVRLARRAFQRAYPNELQEMLRLRETPLGDAGEVTLAIAAEDLSDQYTAQTTPYVSVASRLVRVYAYRKGAAGIESSSIEDITPRCRTAGASAQSISVIIPCRAATRGWYAAVLVAFTHLTPDVFAPHLLAFQRSILRQYADTALVGAAKDEWGFPPCYDGCPAKNDFWFSRAYANAYAEE